MTKEPSKTNPEPGKPSPRKIVIALLPRWKKPVDERRRRYRFGPIEKSPWPNQANIQITLHNAMTSRYRANGILFISRWHVTLQQFNGLGFPASHCDLSGYALINFLGTALQKLR